MSDIDFKKMGLRLRKQRELLGYTREELAEKLDVSAKFCSDIELGIKGVSLSTLVRLSEVLCLNVDYILFGDRKVNSAELYSLEALVAQCPANQRSNLFSIVRTFVKSVRRV